MASHPYFPETGKARVFFRFGGRQFNETLKVGSRREAERITALVEETIQDLERGKRAIPADADPAAFILSGGAVESKPSLVSKPFQDEPAKATLGHVLAVYERTLTPGSKEANSLETGAIHARHLKRVIGEKAGFESLGLDGIQRYADHRAREGVGRQTLRKELSTLRMIWGGPTSEATSRPPSAGEPGM